jgi:ABC-2 type transport system permease protein
MKHARVILWAQWRTLRNFYPRAGVGWTAIIGAIWYGFWMLAAVAGARLIANPANLPLLRTGLPGALLIVFLYWQVVPLLMAATGASLELRKLQAYPIPDSQLFAIEVLLRITSGIEMVLVLVGIAAGILMNPRIPDWCVITVVFYIVFNLFLAVGLRDLLMRMMARKRIRELVVFVLIMCSALPQLLLTRGAPSQRLLRIFSRDSLPGWPWTSAANLAQGIDAWNAAAILIAWTIVAAAFGRWQFMRTLTFDKEAASASETHGRPREGRMEGFYRLPSTLLPDPLAVLMEKELRFLVRSPRFRLVFLMGFTFGLVILLPVSLGRASFFGNNYLTVVSVYSLLLMSEACFWNSFGFDRSAAQIYFLAPVPFSRVLIGKNLSALFFIALEILAITAVCALMRMPLTLQRIIEAYSVAGVVTILLMCAGNWLSIHQARGVNPRTQFRSNAAGRVQALLVVIYPLAFIPVALAYLARWAFDAEWVFFAVLAFDAIAGLIVYRFALESAVESADRLKEQMIAALSAGEGPIAG